MSLKNIHDQIKKGGKIQEADTQRLSESLHGRRKKVSVSKKADQPRAVFRLSDESDDTTEGREGDFKQTRFKWDRVEREALFVMYVNAADPIGLTVEGLKAGDIVQITSISGLASFDEDDGNPTAAGLVGLLATGAEVALTISGNPEFIPLVEGANKFAQDQFKATKSKEKLRDGFGLVPERKLNFPDVTIPSFMARQEGGIIVCLPEAGGAVYSGEGEERWVKKPGDRIDANRPKHATGCFFPIRSNETHNLRQLKSSGVVKILAWDHIFDDNAGFYEVVMHIQKGKLVEPGPVR